MRLGAFVAWKESLPYLTAAVFRLPSAVLGSQMQEVEDSEASKFCGSIFLVGISLIAGTCHSPGGALTQASQPHGVEPMT